MRIAGYPALGNGSRAGGLVDLPLFDKELERICSSSIHGESDSDSESESEREREREQARARA